MIAVTERAKDELCEILAAQGANEDEGLRLLPDRSGKFALILDNELPGDQVVEYKGLKVLLVSIEYFSAFDEVTLDCRDGEEGPVLFVR